MTRREFLGVGAGAFAAQALADLKVFETGIADETVLKIEPVEIDLRELVDDRPVVAPLRAALGLVGAPKVCGRGRGRPPRGQRALRRPVGRRPRQSASASPPASPAPAQSS